MSNPELNSPGRPTTTGNVRWSLLAPGMILIIVAIAWIGLYYASGNSIPVMSSLGTWNFLIGLVLFIVGVVLLLVGLLSRQPATVAVPTMSSGTSLEQYVMVTMPDGSYRMMPVAQPSAAAVTQPTPLNQ